ncbi:MAG: undecaprenyl/decaprenyl-phosphate alpha-N-acetylglucosaminyl 1-phosphate transferase [Flavobacteriales bacterium]|nr:undecaprenyl/decaprenyl-phosphate alpha-N-acetylglucosaminyl 1-phosphate transferase [Flavobacteriales bacterium]
MPDKESLFWIYSAYYFFIVGFTILVNGILLKFSRSLGIRDASTTVIRWSAVSKPALGGITFFLAFLITISTFSIFFPGALVFHNKPVLGLISICIIAFMMGLADDAYNTKPLLKLFVQIACGVILYFTENYIKITPWEWLNIFLTLLWVVGIMNSINMLDNMDGITTVVSIGIILMFMTSQVFTGSAGDFDLVILLAVMASLIGFLFHNWHPSKMFMGDTGSQFLGAFLAYYGIRYFWNGLDHSAVPVQAKQFTLVLIGFMVPFIDTTIVVINRIARGQSPMVGGKDHTTHHLSYLGFSDAQVAFIFIALNSISLLFVFIIIRIIDDWSHLFTLLFWSYFLIVFLIMFLITRKNGNHGGSKKETKQQA